jgi:steroid delta-isomerase-like uncharacterized protein
MSRFVVLAIAALAAVSSLVGIAPGGLAQDGSPMAGEMPPVAVAFAEAWSSGDPDQVAALYAEDALFEEVILGGAVTSTRDDLRAYVGAVFAAFPDFTATPSAAYEMGDVVVIEWVLTGTYQGTFGTLPPGTGQPVEVRLASVLEVGDDGLITRDSEYWDVATLLTQVGAMPGAEATPAA